MGWKNVKEHYGIEHIVQVVEGKGVCIGSGYVHDLIVADPVKRTLRHTELGLSANSDLERYWKAMNADLPKLWELIEAPDTFQRALPVYTCRDGEVIQDVCEAYGWPNTTHAGTMMYANRFFESKQKAVENYRERLLSAIESWKENVQGQEKKLAEYKGYLQAEQDNLAKLEKGNVE